MEIVKFKYDKGDGLVKDRVLLVRDETDEYIEGYDLQDLEPFDLALLEDDKRDMDEILVDYDLNMFKRFLKRKIVGTIS